MSIKHIIFLAEKTLPMNNSFLTLFFVSDKKTWIFTDGELLRIADEEEQTTVFIPSVNKVIAIKVKSCGSLEGELSD